MPRFVCVHGLVADECECFLHHGGCTPLDRRLCGLRSTSRSCNVSESPAFRRLSDDVQLKGAAMRVRPLAGKAPGVSGCGGGGFRDSEAQAGKGETSRCVESPAT
jgi:hypothetical protein